MKNSTKKLVSVLAVVILMACALSVAVFAMDFEDPSLTVSIDLGKDAAGMGFYVEQDGLIFPDTLAMDDNGHLEVTLGETSELKFTSKPAVVALSASTDDTTAEDADAEAAEDAQAAEDAAAQDDVQAPAEETKTKKKVPSWIFFLAGLALCIAYLVADKVNKNKKGKKVSGGEDDAI